MTVNQPISQPALQAKPMPGRQTVPSRLFRGLMRFGFDAAVLPVLFCAVAGYFGRFAWLLDMTNFFRPHAAALALGLLLVAGLGRCRLRFAIGVAILLAAALPLFVPSAPAAVAAEAGNFRVLSTNVMGGENGDVDAYRRLIADLSPDLIVAQEVAPQWQGVLRSLPGYPYFSRAELMGGESTVLIASRFPIRSTRLKGEGQAPFAFGAYPLRVEVDRPGTSRPLVVFGMHPPTPRSASAWQERNAYLAEIAALAAAEAERADVILAGDWNTPYWSPFFASTIRTAQLRASEGAWPAPTRIFREFGAPDRLGSPIDHVAVSPRIGVAAVTIGTEFGSDHLPLIADLKIP